MPEKNTTSKTVWNIIKISLAIVLVWFVFSKTNFSEVAALAKQLSWPWLLVSFVLFCMLTLLKTYQYYVLTGRQAPYGRVLYVVITQNAISNFIAGGAGIASYLTMLSVDEGVRFRKVLSSFIIVKMGDLLSVWLVLFVTAYLVWPQIGVVRYLVVFLLLAILITVGSFLAAAFLRQKFVSFIRAVLSALRLDKLSFVRTGVEMLASFADQDSKFILRALLTGLLYSSIYMALTLFWYYSNIRAYSLVFPFAIVSFVNAFLQLISWIPIQVFGGLGVTESSSVFLFGLFGLPTAQIAAMAIGLRAVLYASTLVLLLYLPASALFGARNWHKESS
jgi:uncharacterized membrane protein YbhN (UPF0104 family)